MRVRSEALIFLIQSERVERVVVELVGDLLNGDCAAVVLRHRRDERGREADAEFRFGGGDPTAFDGKGHGLLTDREVTDWEDR